MKYLLARSGLLVPAVLGTWRCAKGAPAVHTPSKVLTASGEPWQNRPGIGGLVRPRDGRLNVRSRPRSRGATSGGGGGGSAGVLFPNLPGGLTHFLSDNCSALPGASNLTIGKGSTARSPSGLISVQGSSPAFIRHIIESGTPAGNNEAGSDFAQIFAWDAAGFSELTGAQKSTLYEKRVFNIFGNGTNIETPPTGIKFGYWGVTNQDGVHGPTQIYGVMAPVVHDSSSPIQATEFQLGMTTQNGSSTLFAQNLNTSKHIIVGQQHTFEMVCTLGTNGGGDGTWDWWLDGTKIGHYTNVPFISSAFAAGSGTVGTGLSGFWGMQRDWYWGGQGGAAKTRDDYIYVYSEDFWGA